MVVNKTYIARYWKPEPKDENNLIAKMLLLFLFWCSVDGHRKDSLEHHLLQPGCIQYTSESYQTIQWSYRPGRQHHPSVYWQVTTTITVTRVSMLGLPAPTMPCSLQFMTEATSMTATALGKDLCLLASACLAKDRLAYNCNERQ